MAVATSKALKRCLLRRAFDGQGNVKAMSRQESLLGITRLLEPAPVSLFSAIDHGLPGTVHTSYKFKVP
jgi:hypothetical protein